MYRDVKHFTCCVCTFRNVPFPFPAAHPHGSCCCLVVFCTENGCPASFCASASPCPAFRSILLALLGLLWIFGLCSQRPSQTQRYFPLERVTAALVITPDSRAFTRPIATNSAKLQISFTPFAPLSFEFSALGEKLEFKVHI